MDQYLTFTVDEQKFAIPLAMVDRVIRAVAVEVKPFPEASEFFVGIINMHGQLVPVIDFRKQLSLQDREIKADDQFIICRTLNMTVVLPVNNVEGVIQPDPSEVIRDRDFAHIHQAIKSNGEMIMVYDPSSLMSNVESTLA